MKGCWSTYLVLPLQGRAPPRAPSCAHSGTERERGGSCEVKLITNFYHRGVWGEGENDSCNRPPRGRNEKQREGKEMRTSKYHWEMSLPEMLPRCQLHEEPVQRLERGERQGEGGGGHLEIYESSKKKPGTGRFRGMEKTGRKTVQQTPGKRDEDGGGDKFLYRRPSPPVRAIISLGGGGKAGPE